MSSQTLPARDRLRRIRLRNRVTLWVLAAAAVSFYLVTILRIG